MIGTPYKKNAKKILLLGSGELGRELALELMRLGCEVIACDNYDKAPAMQVAHRSHVFSMLDSLSLEKIIREENPDLIVPEVEAIATDSLLKLEKEGFKVIPNARATKLTMDREGIRRLAFEELELPTAKYDFSDSKEELEKKIAELGLPVIIKPLMSSSGKGQSLIKTKEEINEAWKKSQEESRSGKGRVIVEEFVSFESEITLLTVRAKNGTFFCDPIGHLQKSGDYVESWQPHPMSKQQLLKAQAVAKKMTDHLGGFGLFGVELFLLKNGEVLFSEVSPRPHDTGMVTMMTQKYSEFSLHARAILGFHLHPIERHSVGASAALKSLENLFNPTLYGVEEALKFDHVDIRFFSKPKATIGRRMAVVLASSDTAEKSVKLAKEARSKLQLRDH